LTHSFKKLRSTLRKQWKKLNQMMVLNVQMYKNKHFRKKTLHFQEILLKTNRSRVDEGKERNQQVDKRKMNAIFNCKTDYWSLGVTLYIMDNEVRMSHQQLQPVYQ
jgi:hypothetical protein